MNLIFLSLINIFIAIMFFVAENFSLFKWKNSDFGIASLLWKRKIVDLKNIEANISLKTPQIKKYFLKHRQIIYKKFNLK